MNEPKKLYRVEHGAMLAGVCGGIAEYFNLDPGIIRLLWVIFCFAGTVGIWLYIAAAIILPKKSEAYPGYWSRGRDRGRRCGAPDLLPCGGFLSGRMSART